MENEEYKDELNEIEEEEEAETFTKNEIISYNASYSLPEYSSKFAKGIFYRPEFQRNYIWDKKRSSRLIESFISDFPIPPVFLYREPQQEKYMIIDGFQRISTIHSYLNNEFVLTGVDSRINENSFKQLEEEEQEILNNRQLSCVIIRQLNPNTKEVLYSLFERLNTGGQNLNNMEVRRAINYGPLMKTLEELNTDTNWRKILGKKDIDDRFLDIELILRIFAFSEKWDSEKEEISGYMTSIKPFLNKYSEDNKEDTKQDLANKFKIVVNQIVSELGEKPFTLYSRPNYALLDSIISANMIKHNEGNIAKKVEALRDDQEYKKIYEAKQGSLSSKNVNLRMKIALEYIR